MADYPKAAGALLEAHELLRDAFGPTHARTIAVVESLVELYGAWEKPSDAAQWRARLPGADGSASD